MNLVKKLSASANVVFALLAIGSHAEAQYAVNVASYTSGTTPASGFVIPTAALGSPEHFTGGSFPGVVSPFSPPFLKSQIVSVGEGGSLTLRLSNYAVPQAGAPEIGLFSNFGLIDVAFPNGQAGTPASGFSAPDSAFVEVSANGASWVSLGNVALDIPTNGYTDVTDPFSAVPGSAPSDFQQPFIGSLSSFDGLNYAGMVGLLAGSGGGKWLDISGTGLPQVGFVRLSLADDGDTNTKLNFEIDGVAVSHVALGGIVVPEPTTITLFWLALCVAASRRRRSLRAAE